MNLKLKLKLCIKENTIRKKIFNIGFYQSMSIRPSLKGPGYECEPAFPQKSQQLTAANVIEFRDSEYEIDDREDLR